MNLCAMQIHSSLKIQPHRCGYTRNRFKPQGHFGGDRASVIDDLIDRQSGDAHAARKITLRKSLRPQYLLAQETTWRNRLSDGMPSRASCDGGGRDEL